jgi:hypothetical protein
MTLDRRCPCSGRTDVQPLGGREQKKKNIPQLLLASLVLLSVLSRSTGARADTGAVESAVGNRGDIAISVERLFGFVHTTTSYLPESVKSGINTNRFSLLGSQATTSQNFYTFPRLAADYFLMPKVSIGGSLAYFHNTQTHVAGGVDNDISTISGFLIAPRVGFAARLGTSVSLWLRGGVSYVRTTEDETNGGVFFGTATDDVFGVTLEAPLALALFKGGLIVVGPTVDVGVSGSNKFMQPNATPAPTTDWRETDIGIHAGLVLVL